jgi:RNase P/RNase MRP subunit p29
MISEEQLDQYRLDGTRLRVVRDADPKNDVKGIVVAWDDHTVAIRKQNRNIVKLNRNYHYQPFTEDRHNEWLEETPDPLY